MGCDANDGMPMYAERSWREYERKHGVVRCPDCGKVLRPEMNNEACPQSLRKDGLHPVMVVDFKGE